jgi:hypothetical protein
MSAAQKVVTALLDSNIRDLIRAGLPRQNAKHKIAKVFQDMGWTILDMSDKGYRNAVSVCFKTNVPRLQTSHAHVRAEIREKLDAWLGGAMQGVYSNVSFPTVGPPKGWGSTDGGEEPLLYYGVVIELVDYSSEYKE